MPLPEPLRKQISELVTTHRVVLFMKGNRRAPQCGFSAQVVQILDELGPAYETVDVLSSPALRDGIKEFSEWPTIPQLYVGGRFVGGCDIVREMHAGGELQKLLGVTVAEPKTPAITLSPAAAKAFEDARAEAGGDPLRLSVGPAFQYELFFGPREPGDLEVESAGIEVLVDRGSATRADGLRIDYVEGPNGGFKIDNPNEPPRVRQLSAGELATMLGEGKIELFDVRPESERAIAKIAAARALDAAGQAHLAALDRQAPIAVHCHHGVRSQAAAEHLVREGFKTVYNLKGGIDAWSLSVDPSVPRY